MWDEDQDLRDALRTELAERTPPAARSGLAEVVGRGRRRRRGQQLGVALAVAAAVSGTAGAMAVLGGPNSMPPADRVTTVTTAPPADAAWPRADLPAHTPYGTWTPAETAQPPAGRAIVSVPQCSIPDTSDRELSTVRPDQRVRQRVAQGVTAVADGASVGELVEWHVPPRRSDQVDTYTYEADVRDADGTGSVVFSVGRFDGDPTGAADEQAFDEFNCDPPKRHVLEDGTVLQLYPMQPSDPFQSLSQVLRVYRPGGELYTLTVRNFGSPDLDRDAAEPRIGPGRETLPLSEGQLAELGLAVATN